MPHSLVNELYFKKLGRRRGKKREGERETVGLISLEFARHAYGAENYTRYFLPRLFSFPQRVALYLFYAHAVSLLVLLFCRVEHYSLERHQHQRDLVIRVRPF